MNEKNGTARRGGSSMNSYMIFNLTDGTKLIIKRVSEQYGYNTFSMYFDEERKDVDCSKIEDVIEISHEIDYYEFLKFLSRELIQGEVVQFSLK